MGERLRWQHTTCLQQESRHINAWTHIRGMRHCYHWCKGRFRLMKEILCSSCKQEDFFCQDLFWTGLVNNLLAYLLGNLKNQSAKHIQTHNMLDLIKAKASIFNAWQHTLAMHYASSNLKAQNTEQHLTLNGRLHSLPKQHKPLHEMNFIWTTSSQQFEENGMTY